MDSLTEELAAQDVESNLSAILTDHKAFMEGPASEASEAPPASEKENALRAALDQGGFDLRSSKAGFI
eukprot:11575698-Alexandrium_andersonii.AAC.1